MKDLVSLASESLLDMETESDAKTAFHRSVGRRRTLYTVFGKRALDIFIVVFTIILLLPVILVCAAVTALDGHWPFFGHKRVGVNGRQFRCWKVRSMLADSELHLKAHIETDPAARDEWAKTRKLKNDPRITRFGRFLRKSSLDELPQILNVLKGEMSIVGPRPVVRDELALYGKNQRAYLEMRPGITGLWQVSGRNDVSYDERIAFDQEYSDTFSLKRDVSIILQTFRVVLMFRGR